jgi:hypothetical protein
MQNKKSILKLGTDQLWISVILAGFLFYVSLIPIPPNDFWWHLKIGEIIFVERYIPTTNMLAWTLPDNAPFYYASWFGELLFYVIYRFGGLEMIVFIKTLLAGITFGLVGYLSKVKSGSWRIAAITTAIACIMSMNNLPVRTQIWAWIPFVLFLIILNNYTEKNRNFKQLLFLPIIMAFWINVHGTFILGFILLGIYMIGEVVQRFIKKNEALEWRNIFELALVSGISALAILINPRGFRVAGYVSSILTNQPIQSFIEEWLPPTPGGIANVMFFSSVIGMILVFAYSQFKPKVTEILLVIAFLWLAFNGQRSVIWYAIVSMPILAKGIALLPIKAPDLPVQYKFSNFVILSLIFLPVLLVQPWFIRNFPLPETYLSQVILDSSEGPLLAINTPLDASRYLIEHPGGRLFNEMGYGSYLIWSNPDQKVFIDPRIELYPQEIWEDYMDLSRGINTHFLLDSYQITRVMLDKSLQKGLGNELQNDAQWLLEYEDKTTQIWKNMNGDSNEDD